MTRHLAKLSVSGRIHWGGRWLLSLVPTLIAAWPRLITLTRESQNHPQAAAKMDEAQGHSFEAIGEVKLVLFL